MLMSGEEETAVKLALKVRSEAADDPEAAALAAEVLSTKVPSWHFRLVSDHARNAAFDAAIRRNIKPGMRVLDIGSGTGLLAMMAARAGAAQVFSCEMNPAVADAARDIIAANGFSDRIRVLSRHSDKLDVNADLGGRVDVIVSEIASNDLLGEGVLATMEHAVQHFLKPDGRVIPQKGTVKIALAFDPDEAERHMGIVDGFDLTAFNRLVKPRHYLPTTNTQLRLMSEAADLFEFDFRSVIPAPDARTQRTLLAHGGPFNCVAQWIHLQMDEAGTHENRPGSPDLSNWAVVAYAMPDQLELQPGDPITLSASHDRIRVRIWTAPNFKTPSPVAR